MWRAYKNIRGKKVTTTAAVACTHRPIYSQHAFVWYNQCAQSILVTLKVFWFHDFHAHDRTHGARKRERTNELGVYISMDYNRLCTLNNVQRICRNTLCADNSKRFLFVYSIAASAAGGYLFFFQIFQCVLNWREKSSMKIKLLKLR